MEQDSWKTLSAFCLSHFKGNKIIFLNDEIKLDAPSRSVAYEEGVVLKAVHGDHHNSVKCYLKLQKAQCESFIF